MRPMTSITKRPADRILYLLPFTALLLGGSIYLFLRPEEPLFFQWARSAGMAPLLDFLEPSHTIAFRVLPDLVIYSLPGALWAFGYALIITGIWINHSHYIKYLWFSTIPLLTLGFEILQYPGIIPGTFSFPDLIAGLAGSAAGIFFGILSKHIRHENK